MNPPSDTRGTAQALSVALQRLEASRAALRGQLLPAPHAGPEAGTPRSARRQEAWWRMWRGRLQQMPLAALLVERARAWWRAQPWHAAGEVIVDGAREQALPWVRRHPAAALVLAAGTGAALVALRRPLGRWLAPPLRRLPRQLARGAVRELSQEPWPTLLAGLVAASAPRRANEGDPHVR